MRASAVAEAVLMVRERMDAAARRAGRDPAGIRLMAVSKFHGPEAVREAYGAGLRLFGESRVQEAREKFSGLSGELPGAEIHLIGSLQRNKAKSAAELFACVQSADRDEIVEELARRAAAAGKRLDILLELHTGEESKAGYPDEDSLFRAADLVLASASLSLRGLMTMAPYTEDAAPIRASFRKLRGAYDHLRARYPEAPLDTLSMGMTNDFELAIEEGATLVRVGTAIFGPRPSSGAEK